MSGLRKIVPWWIRIGAKVGLARLPMPYAFWKRLRLFEHGDMNKPQRALTTFLEHAKTADVLNKGSALPRFTDAGGDFVVLELGPGDSLFSAVIAKSLGASRTWLVDAEAYASTNIAAYTGLSDFLRRSGFVDSLSIDLVALTDILNACNAEYLIEGVRSLTRIPSASVNFCFSNAVLEHIPKNDFEQMANELRRVLKPGGVSVHRVDLKDHLGGRLNNLRFSEATWEGPLFRRSGFYTNRIRFHEMVARFERAGFACCVPRVLRWDRLPTPKTKLDGCFRSLPDDDLLVSGFDIVLSRKD